MRLLALGWAGLALAGCEAAPSDIVTPPSTESAVAKAPPLSEAPVETPTSTLAATSANAVSCSTAEEVIFQCKLANGKHLSVCAPETGPAEYRYGTGQAELNLKAGKWASAAYSGGGEAQIAFTNGDTSYIVFSRMVRTNFAAGEPNYPAISDGVIVLRGQKVLAVQSCDDVDGMPIQYDAAEKAFEREEELFTYETGRADPS